MLATLASGVIALVPSVGRVQGLQDQESTQVVHEIVLAQERYTRSFMTFAVTGSASIEVDRGDWVGPVRALGTFSYATQEGRVLLTTEGHNIGLSSVAQELEVLASATVKKLWLPGGTVMELNVTEGRYATSQQDFADPRFVFGLILPAEYMWTLCQSLRTTLLQKREVSVESVTGEPGERSVRIRSFVTGRRNEYIMTFREAWGWLCSDCLMRDALTMQSNYRIEVREVHKTRLGAFPSSAVLDWKLSDNRGRDAAGGGVGEGYSPQAYHVETRFDPPSFTDIRVPRDISSPGSPMALLGDRYFDNPDLAVLAGLGTRGDSVGDALTDYLGTREIVRSPGVLHSNWLAVALWATAGGATILFGIKWRGLSGYRRFLLLGAGLTLLALARFDLSTRVGQHEPTDARNTAPQVVLFPIPEPEAQNKLCGVDCLYAALLLSGKAAKSYLDVLQLVRPGSDGTTLGTIQDVATALDIATSLVDPREFVELPTPLVCHVAPKHFVLILESNASTSVVFDPRYGIVREATRDLRDRMSAIAIALRKA